MGRRELDRLAEGEFHTVWLWAEELCGAECGGDGAGADCGDAVQAVCV